MLRMLRNRRQKGFTLIELLIVIAIIGIIAALLIPNFLDALQKAKQKRTVGDVKNMGTALFSWLTDMLGAAAAGQTSTTTWNWGDATASDHATLSGFLVPQYIQKLPEKDGWGTLYEFALNDTDNLLAERVMGIRSLGRDKTAETDAYTPGAFFATEYDEDIVYGDGFFVRWPSGSDIAAAP